MIAADDHILDDMEAPSSDLPMSTERIARRVAELHRQNGSLFAHNVDISLPARPEIPSDTPSCLDSPMFAGLSHVNLPGAVADLIGDEISLDPICHVRINPPQVVMDCSTNCSELKRT